ncbi:DNA polymerase ligase N-terminal domain-containing protein [Zavarzinella formosa]|uniref:DNA polymerase ligase N-terminal domain-containing protein n=1 Tax=Zavarzinella formosa TaxID=360055 RepID=UPI000907B9F7
MPRFALLLHDHPETHWDFLLETPEALRAWRLSRRPSLNEIILAEPLPDHRKLYLEYEGPISGNRGNVIREDGGEFQWMSETPDGVHVAISGSWLIGETTILKTESGLTFRWTNQGLPAPRKAPVSMDSVERPTNTNS